MDLNDRAVIVTGSTSGIGEAIARRLAGYGAGIVIITSIAGVRQTGSSLPYAVSKAAVNHLTTILAKHAGDEVRVNAVAPGLVATPWTETWDQLKEGVAAMAPLHRVATPDDIAD